MNVTRVDQPDPNVTLWATETDDGAVYVDAPDEATARTKLEAYFNAPTPAPAPTAVEIANALVDAVTTAADFDAAKKNLAAAQAGLPPTAAATKTGKTARGK